MTVLNPFPNPENTMIIQSTIPVFILYHTKAATVAPRMCVQSAGDGDADDLLEVIFGAAGSKSILGWVLFNVANKITLGENVADPLKTSTFASGDGVWIGMRIPVCEGTLTTGAGAALLPGTRLIGAGAGLLTEHPDNMAITGTTTAATTYYLDTSTPLSGLYHADPTLAILLSRATTADAIQHVQIMPLW